MKTIKTTFELPAGVHRRLKATSARLGVNARDLVVEGLELVLSRAQSDGDAKELQRRAKEARETLRAGLFDGPDDLSETYETRLLLAAEPRRPLR
ncbi:MAG: hypothetical protein U0228_33715 [Myxococcaceae bacterium]